MDRLEYSSTIALKMCMSKAKAPCTLSLCISVFFSVKWSDQWCLQLRAAVQIRELDEYKVLHTN